MKQTALEWLYQHLFPKQLDGFSNEEWNKIDIAFEKAKTMEKEQIMESYMNAKLEHIDTLGINAQKNKIIKDTEQYFQETYGGDK